ncbi:dinitrogenase reductase activating glycohydrolase (draG) [hydrothermal vent metagenome]|uniref:Dinitrogenase reductase activating glycohydrolase (DraG) n=1 Tax=hydrothermal vent metagenome TaxID=652676 RepID=A0A1W1CR33_9ZZZZ
MNYKNSLSLQQKIYGSIMGTALGDSIGLPFEALSRKKIAKKKPSFEEQSLFLGRGMFSDDTEQTISVAQSLIEGHGDSSYFKKVMRRRLQLWFLALPAGIGFATMRAIIKSFFVEKSGVFSAGNAPAMRSALLGLLYGDDNEKLKEFIKVNTEITHTDPKAYYGALSVAKASYLASLSREDEFFDEMFELIDDKEFREILKSVRDGLELSSLKFAESLGLGNGVGGYIYHTLPIVLHSWLRNRDNLKQSIIDVVLCGGDTDTTGAIVGSIVGAKSKSFPKKWVDGIFDFPRDIDFIDRVSSKLALAFERGESIKPPTLSPFLIVGRNILFLLIVIVVSFTRQF